MTDPEAFSLAWRKSTASDTGTCVEVAFQGDSVLVRHSHSPSGPLLTFSRPEWIAFLRGAGNGEFDLPEA